MSGTLAYGEARLTDQEISWFGPGQWLNDNCIHFCFERIVSDVLSGTSDGTIEALCSEDNENPILLLNPSVVSCLRFSIDEPDELEALAEGISLDRRHALLVPISDAEAMMVDSGSHWSLLLVLLPQSGVPSDMACYSHFDSSASTLNRRAADSTARDISQLLRARYTSTTPASPDTSSNKSLTVVEMDGSKQSNGYDCGFFVVDHAASICRLLMRRLNSKELVVTLSHDEILATVRREVNQDSVRALRADTEMFAQALRR